MLPIPTPAVSPVKPIAAADHGRRPAMPPDQAKKGMGGRCPTSYVPPPYLTCVNGGFLVPAPFTKKGRLNWASLIEPSQQDPLVYASALAAELGFEGPGKRCEV